MCGGVQLRTIFRYLFQVLYYGLCISSATLVITDFTVEVVVTVLWCAVLCTYCRCMLYCPWFATMCCGKHYALFTMEVLWSGIYLFKYGVLCCCLHCVVQNYSLQWCSVVSRDTESIQRVNSFRRFINTPWNTLWWFDTEVFDPFGISIVFKPLAKKQGVFKKKMKRYFETRSRGSSGSSESPRVSSEA